MTVHTCPRTRTKNLCDNTHNVSPAQYTEEGEEDLHKQHYCCFSRRRENRKILILNAILVVSFTPQTLHDSVAFNCAFDLICVLTLDI